MLPNQDKFEARCRARGLDDAAYAKALASVVALRDEAGRRDDDLPSLPVADLEAAVARLAAGGQADEAALMALARYFVVSGRNDAAVRLLAIASPIGILEGFAGRVEEKASRDAKDRVMGGVRIPPKGSLPDRYPEATAAFVRALEAELGTDAAREVLTWNAHGMPAAAYADEKAAYEAATTIDEWLAGMHGRLVATLSKHAADGTLWYEQRITPPVVEWIKAHPEVQVGVRDGEFIYVSKIPYDVDRWLVSPDPGERRRLACHCPLAASSITAEAAGVPAAWCACSAGYEKFKFDVVFGTETECRVVESVLAGAPRCRFAVRIPPDKMK